MKILIADDEALVRQSIHLYLTELGILPDDIAEVSNGLALLEAVSGEHFDLALIDIRMPSMTGLEAIRQAQEKAPQTDFYIISGFDDFQYAREALRLGVRDYLLKPISRTQLKELLERTLAAMEQKQAQLIKSLSLSVSALFTFAETPILFPVPCHTLLVTNDIPGEEFSASGLPPGAHDGLILLTSRQQEGTFLFLFETGAASGRYSSFLVTFVRQYKDRHAIIEGRTMSGSQNWKMEHDRMTGLAACRFLFGGHRLYKSALKVPALSRDALDLCCQCSLGMRAYANKDFAGFTMFCDFFSRQIDPFYESSPTPAKNLLTFLKTAYHLEESSPSAVKKGLALLSSMMGSASSRDYRYDEITAYIQEHYRESISLAEVSAAFGLTPSYFSTLFKRKTGCTFVHYLTMLRIAESKRLLLETRMTVRDIGTSVGYFSTSFYIRLFKKMEGITPSEYRRQHGCAD